MNIGIETTVKGKLEEVILNVEKALKEQGFGVLTRIDVDKTLKEKIGADFRPYTILGACNPKFAYDVLQKDSKIGLFLPCNVTVEEVDGGIRVTAINPNVMIQSTDSAGSEEIITIANEAKISLEKAINSLT
ncbi:MAG: DUF302 domain-containing protein [Anaerolineales bacterium]|nr:DUF302 domain-containing protein [Anaerolineales bacterium]